jgi:hypothetical protein
VSGPTIKRDGDTWALAWEEHDVAMALDRLKERSDGLRAEITVEGTFGRVVGPVDLNLLSSESQTRFANVCAKRVNGLSSDVWHALVIQACAIVAKEFRQPTPTVDLSELADSGPIVYLDQPESSARSGLIPKGETTVMYGDGESGKSLLALRIGFSVALGHELPWGAAPKPGNVLYLDWETVAATVANRLRRIAFGEACAAPRIHYRQCFRSLADELPHIKEEISKKSIDLVIVDSIGFAASGALVDDETARSAMNALRNMAPATRLVVAHVSRANAESTSGKTKPFGSAFFWNGMRSGFEVRRAEESSSDSVIDLGIYHWKSNDGRHVKPFGLSVLFDSGSEGVLFERTDINEVPDLAVRTPLSQRIRNMLRKSAMSTSDLSTQLDVRENTVRTTLSRMEGVLRLENGGGRGKATIWGLAS